MTRILSWLLQTGARKENLRLRETLRVTRVHLDKAILEKKSNLYKFQRLFKEHRALQRKGQCAAAENGRLLRQLKCLRDNYVVCADTPTQVFGVFNSMVEMDI